MADFAARLGAGIKEHGPLCIGLDPSQKLLTECGLPDSAEGAFEFGKRVLEAAEYRLALVKPQAAFFERFGSAGFRALEELAGLCRARGVQLLFDGKRGDIDTTAEAYGEAYFLPSSPMRVDAVTVHAYLGIAALDKLLALAVRHGGGVFAVVRSSNPEGEALQQARTPDGVTVAQSLSAFITDFNRKHAGQGVGPLGAVVGATCLDAADTVRALPQSFILAPGVGAQGATIADCAVRMPGAKGRILPSVSRAILANGTDLAGIAKTVRELRAQAQSLC
jgi:orotidine-5'-phosphate decarboxylase